MGPLDGVKAKIQRAEEHIQNLNREITAFVGSDPPPYKVVREHQNKGLQYAFIVSGEVDVPLRFAVMAGEVFHQLRSSLDHLLYALVVKNGGTPTTKTQFPMCSTIKAFEEAVTNGRIKGVSSAAEKLIRSVQPYSTPTPDDTILSVINQYNVLDKHNLLVFVCAVAKLGEQITIGLDPKISTIQGRKGEMPNIVGFFEPPPFKVSKNGEVIFAINLGKPAPNFVADADSALQIAFEKFGRVKFCPVIQALEGITAGTKHTINLFASEFA